MNWILLSWLSTQSTNTIWILKNEYLNKIVVEINVTYMTVYSKKYDWGDYYALDHIWISSALTQASPIVNLK